MTFGGGAPCRGGAELWVPESGGPQTDRAPEPQALSGCVEPEMNIVTMGALRVVPLLGVPGPRLEGTRSLSLA